MVSKYLTISALVWTTGREWTPAFLRPQNFGETGKVTLVLPMSVTISMKQTRADIAVLGYSLPFQNKISHECLWAWVSIHFLVHHQASADMLHGLLLFMGSTPIGTEYCETVNERIQAEFRRLVHPLSAAIVVCQQLTFHIKRRAGEVWDDVEDLCIRYFSDKSDNSH